jgi:flagellin-like protein
LKSRRGVSEIIASLIVLLIVSVMGVMLYNLSVNTMGSQQDALTFNTNLAKKATQQRFEVIDITRSTKNGLSNLNITFYNYGQVDVKITDIYLSNSTGIVHYRLPIQTGETGYLFTPSPELVANNGVIHPSQITYLVVDVTKISQITSCKLVSEEGVISDIKIKI